MIYADHNASAPLSARSRAVMDRWLDLPGNAFSAHEVGRRAAVAVEQARAQVAGLVGARPAEVFFTSGATEANATVLRHGRWLVSAVEHPSVLAWGEATLPVDTRGRVDLDRLPDPAGFDGVAVMLANNETGVVQPVDALAAWAHTHRLMLHVDASQGPGRIPVDGIVADTLVLSAHKIGGPQGVGALVTRRPIEPLLRGGPQERGRRAGTHAVAAIVGFGAAVGGPLVDPRARDRLEAGLRAIGGRVAGGGVPRLPNTTCIGFEGVDANDLVILLDLAGICVSAGSACASGSPDPSHVLRAMGHPGSAVRFSFGHGTPDIDVDTIVTAVAAALGQLRQ